MAAKAAVTCGVLAIFSTACGEVADDPSTVARDDQALAATTTTRPALPEGACVARMSDPAPGLGGTERVLVDSHFPSRAVKVVVHYKSKDSTFAGQTDRDGHAEVEFAIGKPTAGHPVVVDVDVDGAEKCQSTFTPSG